METTMELKISSP